MSRVFMVCGSRLPAPCSRAVEPYSTSATSRAPRASPTRVAKVSTVIRAMSEFSSRSTARKAASPSESPESAAASTAPAPAPSPSAATTLAQSPQDPPENPAPRHDQENEDQGENPADGDLDARWFADGPPNRGGGTGQGDPKLLRERLRDEVHAERQPRSVVFGGEGGKHSIADPARAYVGEEPLGAAAHGDENIAGARPVILPGNEEHDHAGVLAEVAGIPFRADAPLAPDLQRYITRRAVVDIGKRDHRDLAPRFLAHLADDGFHMADRGGIQDAREVVDEPARRRNGDLEEEREEDQRARRLSRASTTSGAKGLTTNSSNCASRARRRLSSPLYPLTATSSNPGWAARRRSATSKPFIPGMPRSIRATCGWNERAVSIPTGPECASATV